MSYGTGSHYLTLSNGDSIHCVVSDAGLGRLMATQFDGDLCQAVVESKSIADVLSTLKELLEVELESAADARRRDAQFSRAVASTL